MYKTRFEAALARFAQRTNCGRSKDDWRLESLDESILLSAPKDADDELAYDHKAVMRLIAHEILDEFEMEIAPAFDKCMSPIEHRMLLALFIVGRHLRALSTGVQVVGFPGLQYTPVSLTEGTYRETQLSILPQTEIDDYTVDFYIEYAIRHDPRHNCRNPDPPCARGRVIVECDGHDYHERTKEQAKRDKERDRELQRQGYKVFRYTGSEIYNDAIKCAFDAMDVVVRMAHEQKKEFDKQYPWEQWEMLD